MYYWNFPLLILLCILHSITSNGNLVDGREYSCELSFRVFQPETRYYERRDTRLNKFSPKNHVIREQNRDLSTLQRSREQKNSRMTERHLGATRQVRIGEDQIKPSRILNRGLRLSQDRFRANFPQVRSENRHYTRLIRARQTEVISAERYESNVINRIDKTQIHTLLRSRSVDDIENLPRRGETTVRSRSLQKIGLENTRTRELSRDRDQVRDQPLFLYRQERLYSPETRRVIGKRNIILENITNNRITDQTSKKSRDKIRGRVSRTKEIMIQSNSEKKSFMRIDIIRETEKRDTKIRSMRSSTNRVNEIDMRNANGLKRRVEPIIREREESQKQIANRDRRIDVPKETRLNSIEARYFNVRRDMTNADQLNSRDRYLNVRQGSLGNRIREDISLKYYERIFFGDNRDSINRFKFNLGKENLQNCNIQSKCDVRFRQRSKIGERENSILRTSGGISIRYSREFSMERDVARSGDSRLNSRDVHLNVRQRLISAVYSPLNTLNAHGIRRSVNQVRQDTFLKSSERLSFKENRDSTEWARNNIERHVAVRHARNADLRLNTRNVQSGKRRLINVVRHDQLSRFERISFRDNRDFSQRVRINNERNAVIKQDKRNGDTQNIRRDVRLNVRERLINKDIEQSMPRSSERISFRDNSETTESMRNNMERNVALRRIGNSEIRNAEHLSRLTTEVREDSLRSIERNGFINNRKTINRVRINVERDVAARGVIRNDRIRRDAQSSRRLENKIREDSFSIFSRADIRENRLSADRIIHNIERSYSEKRVQSSWRDISLNLKQYQFNELRDIPTLISGKGTVQNNRVSTDRHRRNIERGFDERRDVRNDKTQSIAHTNFNVNQRGSRDKLDSLRTRNSRNIFRNMTYKNKTEYDVFNWQALFYTLQAIYICSIVFRTMHKNEFTKKTWSCAWLYIPDTKIN